MKTTRLTVIMLLVIGIFSFVNAQDGITEIPVEQGFGAEYGFWRVFFDAPTGNSDLSTYVGGVDVNLGAEIDAAEHTIDIAAFEFNNPVLTEAIINAHARGVVVRIVADDEHGVEDDDTTIGDFQSAGIEVVDDDRSALMHNKFMIIDSEVVWTGSMNYTINGVYRNNNNMIAMRSPLAVAAYQYEFDEMFERREFGPTSTRHNGYVFWQDGTRIEIYFASEDDVIGALLRTVNSAQDSIRFMSFAFTQDSLGTAVLLRAYSGVEVQGVFETVGSETRFSEMPRLYCSGLDVRQDGNPYILHHKVFIIDDEIVVTGSFNFSDNALASNDENLVIIYDPVLAAQFIAEFERRWAEAEAPDDEDMNCNISRPETPPWQTSTGELTCPSENRTCSALTCAEAYACLGEGVTNLDRDRNGIPCEEICAVGGN